MLGIDKAKSAGLQAAYFGAYPLASLGHANWILRHYGFKPVFIWGLSLYAIGALVAWPCILYKSFGGFCAAIFVCSPLTFVRVLSQCLMIVSLDHWQWSGLSRDCGQSVHHHLRYEILSTGRNAVADRAAGPPRYSEIRINISQAFNGVGTVVAPVIGSYAIFVGVGNSEAALHNVQWYVTLLAR